MYRKFGFIYSPERKSFVPIQFDLSVYSCKEIHEKFGKGITSSTAAYNLNYYGMMQTEYRVNFLSSSFKEKI